MAILLECPFHAWRYDGEEGVVKEIPYSKSIPPQVKRKCTRTWPVTEANGWIWTWYHPDQTVAPMWDVVVHPEEYGDPDWTAYEMHEWMVYGSIQNMAENGVDVAHFKYIHGTADVPLAELRWGDWGRGADVKAQMGTPRRHGRWLISYDTMGPGQSWVALPWDIRNPAGRQPCPDRKRTCCGCAMASPSPRHRPKVPAPAVAKALIRDICKQLDQDKVIWDRMRFEPTRSSATAMARFRSSANGTAAITPSPTGEGDHAGTARRGLITPPRRLQERPPVQRPGAVFASGAVDRIVGVAKLFTGIEQGKVRLGQRRARLHALDQIGIGDEGPAKADRFCPARRPAALAALSAVRLLLAMIAPDQLARSMASVSRSSSPMSTTWRIGQPQCVRRLGEGRESRCRIGGCPCRCKPLPGAMRKPTRPGPIASAMALSTTARGKRMRFSTLPPILVGALVAGGVEELVDQVAAGAVQFHPVKPCRHAHCERPAAYSSSQRGNLFGAAISRGVGASPSANAVRTGHLHRAGDGGRRDHIGLEARDWRARPRVRNASAASRSARRARGPHRPPCASLRPARANECPGCASTPCRRTGLDAFGDDQAGTCPLAHSILPSGRSARRRARLGLGSSGP
jgi:hypothetical protein